MIVEGDVVRRLVARTMAQQLSKAVERATAPFQHALSTKAGCECIAHVLQCITELHPELTITSIGGMAFDMISRDSMLRGLLEVEGGGAALPFVRMFYGSPSEHLWEDDEGTVHRIPQGEARRTGRRHDAPVVSALEAIHRRMNPGEFLMAFNDDVCMATPPARVGSMYAVVQEELFVHAAIRVHHGKTKVWNQPGVRPVGCNALEQIARVTHPEAVVWTGSMVPTAQQGIKVLGTPIGHPDFVAAQLEAVRREHEVLLDRIPSVSDLHCAWLLLVHCASARACHYLRTLRPSTVEEFARAHDAGLWQCLRNNPSAGPPPMLRRCPRRFHTPIVSRGAGTPQFLAFQSCSSLGELGRLPPNDKRQTSRRCSGVVGIT